MTTNNHRLTSVAYWRRIFNTVILCTCVLASERVYPQTYSNIINGVDCESKAHIIYTIGKINSSPGSMS